MHPFILQPSSLILRRQRRSAFTLVELLIVIIIIGLLMGMLVVAIGRAIITANDARVIAEINQLDAAMKKAKETYGSYPPAKQDSSTNDAAVKAFLRRAWPRMSPTGISYANLDPPEVLVYYLGGVPSSSGSSKITGFDLDPTNPAGTGSQRSKPLFDFDQSRLKDLDGDGYWEYYPPKSSVPYTYFDFTTYGSPPTSGSAAIGYAVPYKDKSTSSSIASGATSGGFMNPNSFQIIAAGQDENYGTSESNKIFPDGNNYGTGDNDNLTNFATKRLEDAKP